MNILLYGVENKNIKPLPIGNFSVPIVTQIAPLISFGQLLIDKEALLPQLSGFFAQGDDSYSNTVMPNIIYGIRDDFAIFFDIPINPKSRSGASHSSGIEDIFLQMEYGFYNKTSVDSSLTATIVGNVQFPTGSSKKNPRLGNGWFTYFLGTTLSYLSQNWYAFVSPGVDLPMAHHGIRFGNSYLYQWGFARYIKLLSPPGWIFDVMVEFDGAYVEKETRHGVKNPNSGGNTIIVTPSIWLSSKRYIIQFGIGFPVIQDLHGEQDRIDYLPAFTLGVAFQL